MAGTYRGDLPPQRWGILDVAAQVFSPFGAFKTQRDLPYVGTEYVGLFWEHDFSTVPFELIALRSLARRSIGLTIFGAHGRTWHGAASIHHPAPDRFHHEIGLALTHLFGYPLRLDFTWRLDEPGFFTGFGFVHRF
jgi:hypothetical protein